MQGSILPYRTTPEELLAWVQARARGHTPDQLRQGTAAKAADGIAQTASLLGLEAEGELTPVGQKLALTDPSERRGRLRAIIAEFPPFGAVLSTVREGGHTALETAWIEAWWATRGWGSSPSNRAEASATFGRFIEHVGLGRYVAGRRGHPTRIEWDLPSIAAVLAPAPAGPPLPPPSAPEPDAVQRALPEQAPQPTAINRVEVLLEGGRAARLELPSSLSRGDKRRLIELVDLLVAEE